MQREDGGIIKREDVLRHTQPLSRQVLVSENASELLQDFRFDTFKFGQATVAADVVRFYEAMQLRMYDLADYIGKLEKWHGTTRDVTMKF